MGAIMNDHYELCNITASMNIEALDAQKRDAHLLLSRTILDWLIANEFRSTRSNATYKFSELLAYVALTKKSFYMPSRGGTELHANGLPVWTPLIMDGLLRQHKMIERMDGVKVTAVASRVPFKFTPHFWAVLGYKVPEVA